MTATVAAVEVEVAMAMEMVVLVVVLVVVAGGGGGEGICTFKGAPPRPNGRSKRERPRAKRKADDPGRKLTQVARQTSRENEKQKYNGTHNGTETQDERGSQDLCQYHRARSHTTHAHLPTLTVTGGGILELHGGHRNTLRTRRREPKLRRHHTTTIRDSGKGKRYDHHRPNKQRRNHSTQGE